MKAVRQGRGVTGLLMLLALAGCSSRSAEPPPPNPDEVRAKIVRLMPATVRDRQGWASDIYAAFSAQQIYPSDENLCAVLAVTEQESTYQVDPPVAGLGRIATREVERRAGKLHVPAFLVSSALNIKSPDGRTYSQRLAAARTEKELSETFDDFIAIVPMGGKLFGGFNPVHTGGPMQVSIAFAEAHARAAPEYGGGFGKGLRNAVFTRPGGLYFGIAHLLDYPAPYQDPLFRFADFNAGHYSSRNAAFQQAVARLAGVKLVLDGDLLRYENGEPSGEASATQKAVMALSGRLKLDSAEILAALRQEKREAFARTQLYLRVFAMADKAAGARVPREAMPRIELKSPKIQRKLTTAWFAERVHMRYRACMKRMPGT